MPTTSSHSSSPAKPDQFRFETPGNDFSAARDPPSSTPSDYGSRARKGKEDDTDSVEECEHEEYDNVYEDLSNRVFVDFDVFLLSVLHVPRDWKTLWGPAIEAVKADQVFSTCHRKYCQQCEEDGSSQQSFSEPLIKTTNAIIDVVFTAKFGGISGISHVKNPRKLPSSTINGANLSVDPAVLHNDRQPLHWADNFHILVGKPYDGAICNGKGMPRLIIDGIDPISNHAPPHCPVRSKPREPTSPASSTTSSESTSGPRTKPIIFRLNEEDPTLFRADGENEKSSASTIETGNQSGPSIQVCSYLLEMFSDTPLRSHATICLIDRDRLQLYNADRSVILVSSAINFSKGDGLDQFIAVIVALHCFPLKQNRTLDALPIDDIKVVKNSSDNEVVQNQSKLELTEGGSNKKFSVTLGDIIAHDPAIVGRSTLVRRARSDQWQNVNLVVKISWPIAGWGTESEFLERAIEEAKKTEGGWATKHLPRMFWAKDIVFGQDSTLESVANLFKDAKFNGKKYSHERRVLRIIIQEELYPLKSLTNVKDIGQVFVDIACIHRWLYDHPGILHCDLSMNNIMCRIIEELNAKGEQGQRVYGVLTDYDLSLWTKDLKNNHSKTSQWHAGTLPYMAKELLEGTSTPRMYRHDLESLFCIMFLTCTRYTLGNMKDEAAKEGPWLGVTRGGERPYQDWFDEQNSVALRRLKDAFFRCSQPIKLSPCFQDFQKWLRDLQFRFVKGFVLQSMHAVDLRHHLEVLGGSADEIASFDDETLDGHIDYPSFIKLVPLLEGGLEGLVIHYHLRTTPPPTPDQGDSP